MIFTTHNPIKCIPSVSSASVLLGAMVAFASSASAASSVGSGYYGGEILPASIPAEMGEDTGGNIVMEQAYHQTSIVNVRERIRFQFLSSPDDTYTATGTNIPDGLSIYLESDKKRFHVQGIPTVQALQESPYETEITLSNSTDSRTIKFLWHIKDGVQPDVTTSFRPCGGNTQEGGTLWSWSWAGKDQEHIQRFSADSLNIIRLEDLSGNDHYYYTEPGDSGGHASEIGYAWRNYYTPYPTVGLHRSFRNGANYGSQALLQNGNLDASGPFYLAAAVMNTRTGGNGNRELFGSVWSGNGLKYTQGRENQTSSAVGVLGLWIDGNHEALTPRHSYTSGPMLIEVFRDNNNIVRAMVNGVDLTIGGGVSMPGAFRMSGLSSHSSAGFDDAGFEFIVCKGLPSESQRFETREYLRAKWRLYARKEYGVCK